MDGILEGKKKDNVGILVDELMKELETSKTENLPCEMSNVEWIRVLKVIALDEQLRKLRIKDIQEICVDEPDVLAGQRSVCFVDKKSAFVIFRGTYGNREWLDNAKGMIESDTIQQNAALEYVKYIKKLVNPNYLAVAGHSKGGNKAQYVGLVAPEGMVNDCLSIDGQGFSPAFMEKYKNNIQSRNHINLMAEHRDFVNCLGLSLSSNPKCASVSTNYYRGWRGVCTDKSWCGNNLIHFHSPDSFLFDNFGELILPYGKGLIPSFINDLIVDFLTNSAFNKEERQKTAEYFCSLMIKDPDPIYTKYSVHAIVNLGIEFCIMMAKNNDFSQKLEDLILTEYNVFCTFAWQKNTELSVLDSAKQIMDTSLNDDTYKIMKHLGEILLTVIKLFTMVYQIIYRLFEDIITNSYKIAKLFILLSYLLFELVKTLCSLCNNYFIKQLLKDEIKTFKNEIQKIIDYLENAKEKYAEELLLKEIDVFCDDLGKMQVAFEEVIA